MELNFSNLKDRLLKYLSLVRSLIFLFPSLLLFSAFVMKIELLFDIIKEKHEVSCH